jgi:hypothetical protein
MHSFCDSDDDIPYYDISYNIYTQVRAILVNATKGRNKLFDSNTKAGVHM